MADKLIDNHLQFGRVAQIKGAVLELVQTATSVTAKGQIAFLEGTTNRPCFYDGSTSQTLATSNDIGAIHPTTSAPTAALTIDGGTSETIATVTVSGLLSSDAYIATFSALLPVAAHLSVKVFSATQVRVDIHNCDTTQATLAAGIITVRRIR